jgi:hypothetical protein
VPVCIPYFALYDLALCIAGICIVQVLLPHEARREHHCYFILLLSIMRCWWEQRVICAALEQCVRDVIHFAGLVAFGWLLGVSVAERLD